MGTSVVVIDHVCIFASEAAAISAIGGFDPGIGAASLYSGGMWRRDICLPDVVTGISGWGIIVSLTWLDEGLPAYMVLDRKAGALDQWFVKRQQHASLVSLSLKPSFFGSNYPLGNAGRLSGITAPNGSLTETISGDKCSLWQAGTFTVQTAQKTWSLSRALNGKPFLTFELRPGDRWSGDADDRERSQLAHGVHVAYDTDFWFSFAYRLDSTAPFTGGSDTNEFLTLFSFASGSTNGISGPFTMRVNDGNLEFVTRHSDTAPTDTPAAVVRYSEAMEYGRVYKVVGKIVFGKTSGGALDLYLDGSQAVSVSARIGYNEPVGPYGKMGVYRSGGMTSTMKGLVSNLEIGTASLSDRVANPLPLT